MMHDKHSRRELKKRWVGQRSRNEKVPQVTCPSCCKSVAAKMAEYGICGRCMDLAESKPQPQSGWRRGVTVLKCPHGEIAPGSRFDLTSFHMTRRAGSWPLGMVIRAEDGAMKCVCGDGKAQFNGQLLPQWLRRIA